MSEDCSNCRNQMTGWDGGFFGLPFTCECRIYGETENRKNCSYFEKKITKSYLLDKIKELEKGNEQLRKQVKSSETTSDATSNYNAHLESKITTLEKENEQLRILLKDIYVNDELRKKLAEKYGVENE